MANMTAQRLADIRDGVGDGDVIGELLAHIDELQATVTHYQTHSVSGGYQPTEPGGPIGTPPTTADTIDQGDAEIAEVNRVEAAAEPDMPAEATPLDWSDEDDDTLIAGSMLHDEGSPFHYRIRAVTDLGDFGFDLDKSDDELGLDADAHYYTVPEAKAACQANERRILADVRAEAGAADPDVMAGFKTVGEATADLSADADGLPERIDEPEGLRHEVATWGCARCGAMSKSITADSHYVSHVPGCRYVDRVRADERDAARAEYKAAVADVAAAKADAG